MERPDLRREANDAIRGIKGEVRGAIVLVTDCEKNSVLVGGEPMVLANVLAGAMMKDPNLLALINLATHLVASKIIQSN